MASTNTALMEQYIDKFNQLSHKYRAFEDVLGAHHVAELINFSSQFKSDCEGYIEENRKLRIGVVGQIKAGKSSFLNALLFHGQDLLPKAATPMTAALTVISYREKPGAEVEFYGEDEWTLIENKANKYHALIQAEKKRILDRQKNQSAGSRMLNHMGASLTQSNTNRNLTDDEIKRMINIPQELEAAKELSDMAKKSNINIYDYLGTTQVIDDVDNVSDLLGKLNEFVGAKGRFTPIVKSSNLFINSDTIKDMEIVDTPGINDPIISRGQKTRDFLGKCDVVFLLSYAGQFMDSSDIGLLTQNVPSKGIKNVVLLGSKFDSVLLDEGSKYANLKSALAGVTIKLNKQSENTILPILIKNPDHKILQGLKNCLPPKFISSMAYNIAVNMNHLNREERHILDRLERTFKEFNFNEAILKDLSNIENVKKSEFEKIRTEKNQILEERFNNMLLGQQAAFQEKLQEIKKDAHVNLKNIKEHDEKELNEKHKFITQSMNKVRTKVDRIFDDSLTHMQKEFSLFMTDFKQVSNKYKSIREQTSSREEFLRTERYGFLWLKKRDIYKTVEYSYANTYQAIEQIDTMVIEGERDIKERIMGIINMEQINRALREAIIDAFDLTDENFDFDEITSMVQKTINKISIPHIDLDSAQYSKAITKQFTSENVEGSDLTKLKALQRDIIGKVLKDIEGIVERKTKEITSHLTSVSKEFVNNIIEENKIALEEITRQMKDKDIYIKEYNKVIKILEDDLRIMASM